MKLPHTTNSISKWCELPTTVYHRIMTDVESGLFKNLSDGLITILRSRDPYWDPTLYFAWDTKLDPKLKKPMNFPVKLATEYQTFADKNDAGFLQVIVTTIVKFYNLIEHPTGRSLVRKCCILPISVYDRLMKDVEANIYKSFSDGIITILDSRYPCWDSELDLLLDHNTNHKESVYLPIKIADNFQAFAVKNELRFSQVVVTTIVQFYNLIAHPTKTKKKIE